MSTQVQHQRRRKNSRIRHVTSILAQFIAAQATRLTATASARTFTAGADNLATLADHGFVIGQGPVFVASSGSLPTGLIADYPYWPIPISSSTFRLANSREDAANNVPVLFDDDDSPTCTIFYACDRPAVLSWLTRASARRVRAVTDIDTTPI